MTHARAQLTEADKAAIQRGMAQMRADIATGARSLAECTEAMLQHPYNARNKACAAQALTPPGKPQGWLG